jgi:hypothetical protein
VRRHPKQILRRRIDVVVEVGGDGYGERVDPGADVGWDWFVPVWHG